MKYFLTFCFISLIAVSAHAEEKADTVTIIKEKENQVQISNGITVITIPGENTNGEDLKCVIYEAFGGDGAAGGISCNWTPAHLSKRPSKK